MTMDVPPPARSAPTGKRLAAALLTLALAPLVAEAASSAMRPAPSQPPTARPRHFVGGVWNPEDLVRLPGTSWVIVSAMRSEQRPGALLAIDTRRARSAVALYPTPSPLPDAPAADAFAPHGIDARALGNGRFELLVVDHSGGETIDRFRLRVTDARAPVVESVTRHRLPPGVWANGIAALPDGGFAITQMFDARDTAFVDKFAAAEITGGVWRWSAAAGWRALETPRLSGANGIAATADGSTVFVAEWAARRIWRIPLDGTPARSAPVAFLPDNLRWTDDHRLLLAGQTTTPQTLFGCQSKPRRCPLGYRVTVVDAGTLAMRTLIASDDASSAKARFGGATGALQIGDRLWVGSFTGDRIASFPLRIATSHEATEVRHGAP